MNRPAETAASRPPALACRNVSKVYDQGPQSIQVLSEINLQVDAGERIAIVGRSGSGKSTLLNILGGLDEPSSGEVTVAGEALSGLDNSARARLRNHALGFVYQFHHLLGEFSALENVAMPLLIRGMPIKQVRVQALEILEQVGLAQRVEHKPAELSGGERQRVAIARALVTRPACVLLDEPTGNLDKETAEKIQQLLWQLNSTLGISLVIVTHDFELSTQVNRVLELNDGRLGPRVEN